MPEDTAVPLIGGIKAQTKAIGVVIPPGGITDEVAAEFRAQIATRRESAQDHRKLASIEDQMADAIVTALVSRGWSATEPEPEGA